MARAELDALVDRGDLSEDEWDFVELLGGLLEAWEDRAVQLPDVAGADMVRALLEARGMNRAALVGPVFLTESSATEALTGERALTSDEIGRLAHFFHVSPAAFFPTAEP